MRRLLPCLFLLLLALPVFAATDVYSARYEERGRVLVEMRPIFEALSATVTWVESRLEIRAHRGSSEMVMHINDPQAWVDGKVVRLEVPPRLIGDTTRVPLRFVAQSFGASVQYEGNVVRISTPEQQVLLVHLGGAYSTGGYNPGGNGPGGNGPGPVTYVPPPPPQQPLPPPPPPNRSVPGKWPWTATREARAADLVGHSNWALTLMRMEIDARYGRKFANYALRDYFLSQPWYRPSSTFGEYLLTPLERRNAQIIFDYQTTQFGQPATRP